MLPPPLVSVSSGLGGWDRPAFPPSRKTSSINSEEGGKGRIWTLSPHFALLGFLEEEPKEGLPAPQPAAFQRLPGPCAPPPPAPWARVGALGPGACVPIRAVVRSSSGETAGAGRARGGRQPSVLVAPETWRQARQRLPMSLMATRDSGGGSAGRRGQPRGAGAGRAASGEVGGERGRGASARRAGGRSRRLPARTGRSPPRRPRSHTRSLGARGSAAHGDAPRRALSGAAAAAAAAAEAAPAPSPAQPGPQGAAAPKFPP